MVEILRQKKYMKVYIGFKSADDEIFLVSSH